MSVINGATNTVTATIAVGAEPDGVAVDATTNTIYVANNGDNTVSVINGATNTVTATIPVGPRPGWGGRRRHHQHRLRGQHRQEQCVGDRRGHQHA